MSVLLVLGHTLSRKGLRACFPSCVPKLAVLPVSAGRGSSSPSHPVLPLCAPPFLSRLLSVWLFPWAPSAFSRSYHLGAKSKGVLWGKSLQLYIKPGLFTQVSHDLSFVLNKVLTLIINL